VSVQHLVTSGPLILAMPVAAAAGAVTFLSPCCLPLVPGYLSYVTGMADSGSGTGTGGRKRARMVTGALLFVLGFSAVFGAEGLALGSLDMLLKGHNPTLTRVLGGLTILLGLLFAGVLDRFPFAGRVVKPSARPKAGLAGAPLLGVLFGVGWTPCIGPTLSAVLALSLTTGTATRGAFLAFIYGLGLGIPFLIVAFAFQRAMGALAFARRNARLISRVGGVFLIAVGVLEVTGVWSAALSWLQSHWLNTDVPSL
jgi:cytochrome c-type biogenesis protein